MPVNRAHASRTVSSHVTRLTRLGLPAAFLAAGIVGCGKSERPPTTSERLAAVQTKQETEKDFYVPRKTVDYMSDLKSIKDAPAKPAATERTASEAKGSVAESRPTPVATAPALAPSATPTAPPVQAPQVTPAAPAPAPAQAAPLPTVVASAAPSARPTPPATVTVISREPPDFPRDATRAGIESGTVRARLSINGKGEVTNVAILQATPPRVFDRAVQTALSRWKFNTGAEGRSYDTEVAFKLDR